MIPSVGISRDTECEALRRTKVPTPSSSLSGPLPRQSETSLGLDSEELRHDDSFTSTPTSKQATAENGDDASWPVFKSEEFEHTARRKSQGASCLGNSSLVDSPTSVTERMFDGEDASFSEGPKGKMVAIAYPIPELLSAAVTPTPVPMSGTCLELTPAPYSARKKVIFDFSAYKRIQKDSPYRHAMSAGYLWQSLVGQHVRFPSTWWNGARAPDMGMEDPSPWTYIARHRVKEHPFLNKLVPRRDSPGKLLLHIIVQDRNSWRPVKDIALGCFHSNARGVRLTKSAVPENENCREVWMAVRKRCHNGSVVDPIVIEDDELQQCAGQSPLLGSRHQITNVNVRAVFGEDPPKVTMFLSESELYERLVEDASDHQSPALRLLAQSFSNHMEV